jgi:hypothetical protein
MMKLVLTCLISFQLFANQNHNVPDDIRIKYTASTRGYSINLEINTDSTLLKIHSHFPNESCNKKLKTNISELGQIIKEINRLSFDSTYAAPSNLSAGDGDLATNLKIELNDKRLSAHYDYSNPNINLKVLDSLLKDQINFIEKLK